VKQIGMPRGAASQHGPAEAPTPARRRFHLVLVKPSHYDDDGYVIRWLRSSMPSNSLAALYGLAVDCAERRVLGPATEITVAAYDETNTRIRPERIARDIRAAGGGMVALVGVQSNQFPRAMDIARRLRALGIPVCVGGFHVSGSLAMLPGLGPDLQEATALGVALYAGEAEEGLEELLRDAAAGAPRPVYDRMARLPNLAGVPLPFLPRERLKRTAGSVTTFDAGRGCPFQCSFCTIINVQGRLSRRRTPDDLPAGVAGLLHARAWRRCSAVPRRAASASAGCWPCWSASGLGPGGARPPAGRPLRPPQGAGRLPAGAVTHLIARHGRMALMASRFLRCAAGSSATPPRAPTPTGR
jgi:hypothetical protein